MVSDQRLTDQLRGFLVVPRDPTQRQALANVERQEERRGQQRREVAAIKANDWATLGTVPRSRAEAEDWLRAVGAMLDRTEAELAAGFPPGRRGNRAMWKTSRETRKRNLTERRAELNRWLNNSDGQRVLPGKERRATFDPEIRRARLAKLAAALRAEPTERGIIAALHEAVQHALKEAEARGVDPKELLTDEGRVVMGHVSAWLKGKAGLAGEAPDETPEVA
jgi:hypothetical protein